MINFMFCMPMNMLFNVILVFGFYIGLITRIIGGQHLNANYWLEIVTPPRAWLGG